MVMRLLNFGPGMCTSRKICEYLTMIISKCRKPLPHKVLERMDISSTFCYPQTDILGYSLALDKKAGSKSRVESQVLEEEGQVACRDWRLE